MTPNVICSVTMNKHWVATCANSTIADLLISMLSQIADSDNEPANPSIEEQASTPCPDQLDPVRVGVQMSTSRAYKLFRQLQDLTTEVHRVRDEIHSAKFGTTAHDEIQDFLDVPTVEQILSEAIEEVAASRRLAIVLAEKNNLLPLRDNLAAIQPKPEAGNEAID